MRSGLDLRRLWATRGAAAALLVTAAVASGPSTTATTAITGAPPINRALTDTQPGSRARTQTATRPQPDTETSARGAAAGAVAYEVRIPEPEHHWLEIEMTVRDLELAPLRARMSRSSPGRYAVHEFAKNVSEVRARDGAGRRLAIARPGVDEWQVSGHDGTVRLTYRVFGDHADGTYMAVDTTHAHLNMPATFMWVEGLELRPMTVRFVPPAGSGWIAGTQLLPTDDPLAFTAPNLQYFMDSPVELARLLTSRFTMNRDGAPPVEIRVMAHTQASQAGLDALTALIRRVVAQQVAVFGELPAFENHRYTFLIDTVPWADGDAMEHRNSTVISYPGADLGTEQGRRAVLDAVSHEFFHVWNVERIRPRGLEPFDFTRQNITCCLWMAEGFTEYYSSLVLRRARLLPHPPFTDAVAVATSTARLVRSAVEMSEHAPFADAGVANDADDRARTFISYYTHGAAIALGLDLALRERSGGAVSLDDYMRRLWREFGAPAAAHPGHVARPYGLGDLRTALAAVARDRVFADDFFDRYVEGHDVVDYARLLGLAGYTLRPAAPGRGWAGDVRLAEEASGLRVGGSLFGGRPTVVPYGTPAYEAGLDLGDRIVAIEDQPATMARWAGLAARAPGTRVRLTVERRDGARVTATLTLRENPALQVLANEDLGAPLTEAQRAFRALWLDGPVVN